MTKSLCWHADEVGFHCSRRSRDVGDVRKRVRLVDRVTGSEGDDLHRIGAHMGHLHLLYKLNYQSHLPMRGRDDR